MTISTHKSHKKKSDAVCPNLGIYHIVNTTTGEIVQLPCKRYACPTCGPRKAYKLRKAIEAKFDCVDYVRLFTFNFRTTIFANPKHAILRASEVWRRFINNVRRDKSLHHSLRNFQYIRLIEFTKAGYPHYHVLTDRYLPVNILANHWRHAINIVCHNTGYNGSVNAKGIKTSRNAAFYVVKYVLKTAGEFDGFLDRFFEYRRCKLKLYTKSSLMKLFYPSSSIDRWEFTIIFDSIHDPNLTCKPLAQLPEDFALFCADIPPPSSKFEYLTQISFSELKISNEIQLQIFEKYQLN